MTAMNLLYEEMEDKAAFAIIMDRREDGPGGDGLAVGAIVTDHRGKSLAVEIGSGDDGVYATVRAFHHGEPTVASVFAGDDSTMIVVE